MKKICLVLIMLLVAGNAFAFFVEEKIGEQVKCSYNVDDLGLVEDTAGRDIYVDGVLQVKYNPLTFIGWAMQTYPELIGTAHESALVAFAQDPASMKDLLVARGEIIDSANGGTTFSDLAQEIINQARAMGAKGLD
jgi:hypothetical protein